jgi:hypothetical protein
MICSFKLTFWTIKIILANFVPTFQITITHAKRECFENIITIFCNIKQSLFNESNFIPFGHVLTMKNSHSKNFGLLDNFNQCCVSIFFDIFLGKVIYIFSIYSPIGWRYINIFFIRLGFGYTKVNFLDRWVVSR